MGIHEPIPIYINRQQINVKVRNLIGWGETCLTDTTLIGDQNEHPQWNKSKLCVP